MENIYQEAVRAVEDGARFKVDFQTRSLKIDGKYVIRDGSYEGVLGVPHCSEEEFFSKVEELYPVSYTHLDVYKRQPLLQRGKNRL